MALIVIEIFEQNEEKMQSKLIECCEFIFHIAYILNDKELVPQIKFFKTQTISIIDNRICRKNLGSVE